MSPVQRKSLAAAVAAAAALLLVSGLTRKHRVYEPGGDRAGLVTFSTITERELGSDATFSGTIRKGARLYSTYDRTAPRGKQTCPT